MFLSLGFAYSKTAWLQTPIPISTSRVALLVGLKLPNVLMLSVPLPSVVLGYDFPFL